ncbi:MAG: tetratricopeptide repeat protein [bacterium]|nr:tetratricopeptide repeat protein [bacterium]
MAGDDSASRMADPNREGASARKGWERDAWICVGLWALTLAVFAQVWRFEFLLYDDVLYVTRNPVVLNGLTWEGLRFAFADLSSGLWNPLTWLSHMLDVELFGLNPAGHHLVNLALHVANVILLYLVLREMTGTRWRSALVAALFAIHPLHVEPVAWIASRKDVLSTLFLLATIGSYARYVRGRGWSWYALMIGAFALGLMTKPMLVTLPVFLLLLDYWPLRREAATASGFRHWVPRLAEKVPLFVLAAVGGIVTIAAARLGGSMKSVDLFPMTDRLANATASYAAYLWKTLWPSGLAGFYPHRGAKMGFSEIAIAGCAFLAVSMAVAAFGRRRRYLVTGWLWYVVGLAPVIGIIQIGSHGMADRYTYVPLIGVFVALVWGGESLLPRHVRMRKAAMIASAGVVLAFGISAWVQTTYWHDTERLFRRAIAVTDDNDTALTNLGAALTERGQLDEARECLRQALEIDPEHPKALTGLGRVEYMSGNLQQALNLYEVALEHMPDLPEARINRGAALADLGRYDEALVEYDEAIRLLPSYADAHANAGNALLLKGSADAAVARYETALSLAPRHPRALAGLGCALIALERYEQAAAALEQAVAVEPANPDNHYYLGTAYGRLGRLGEAEAHLVRALELAPGHLGAKAGIEWLRQENGVSR